MTARISTVFSCSEAEFWRRWTDPESWNYIVSPMLRAVPVGPVSLEDEWQVDRTYSFQLHLFNLIPLGRHNIKLIKVDKETNTISSEESGSLAPVWIHHIWFRAVPGDRLAYTDEIEIGAGWLTPVIWLIAHLFYRHRHRRWRKLLREEA